MNRVFCQLLITFILSQNPGIRNGKVKMDYDHCNALADGIKYVFINGKAALADGVRQNVCAGRVLRKNGGAERKR